MTILSICSLIGGADFSDFPKNNSGRNTMIDSPSVISDTQLDGLKIKTVFEAE